MPVASTTYIYDCKSVWRNKLWRDEALTYIWWVSVSFWMVHSVASGPYIYDIIKQGSIWPTIFLLIPLYQAIWEDKIRQKMLRRTIHQTNFERNLYQRDFVWWRVFVRSYYLVGISRSIIWVEIELSNTELCGRGCYWILFGGDFSSEIFCLCKFLFRICWWKTCLK